MIFFLFRTIVSLYIKIWKLVLTIDEKTGDEEVQYDINRDAEKILQLSYCKTNKYESFTSEEILPLDLDIIHPLGKHLKKNWKARRKANESISRTKWKKN